MESLVNLTLYLFLAIYEIYAKIAIVTVKLFPDLVKSLMDYIIKRAFNITINGPEPTDIIVLKPEKFYARVAAYLDLGFFEGYMDEEWTCKDLTGMCAKIVQTRNYKFMMHPIHFLTSRLNLQTKNKAWEVGQVHYDLGNDLYKAMLDTNMQYTCGYWRNAANLNEAQLAKMELIATKLQLKPGMRVLDLGCGFGTLACYLAKTYGVSVVGCTISKEQFKYGQVAAEGLSVELRLCDYRDMDEKFDRVVSVGLMEHIGPKNYKTLLQVAHRCLIDGGLFLVQTIGRNHRTSPGTIAPINKLLFPNGQIPYYLEIAKAIEDLWIIEDWQNFGFDYGKTFAAWQENFENAWVNLSKNYDQKFYRMWIAFLALTQGAFLSRGYQLWQIVLSKDGLKGGYLSVR